MPEQIDRFVRSVKLAKFVLKLMDQPDTEIQPEIDPSRPLGYGYTMAEEFLGKAAREELESMAGEGLLERKFFSKELGCPKDGSINLSVKRYCPHCNSDNISRQELIEHVACGYVGPESSYENDTCPKCHKPQGKLGVDHVKLGPQYVCADCGNYSQAPVEKLICLKDKNTFTTQDAKEIDLYSYKVTDLLKEEINKAIDQQRYISEKIGALGFKVTSPAKLKGRSGVAHEFYMVATTGLGFMKVKVVIELLGDTEVSKDEILGVYAKAIDVGAQGIVVGAVPVLTADAKAIADSYQISYVEAQNLPDVSEKLVEKFAELVESPEDRAMSILVPASQTEKGGQ